MSKQNPTHLAAGAYKAAFIIGANKGDEIIINPGMVSDESEVRVDPIVEPIDRSRSYKKITPKQDQILVQRRDAENISAGGLIIPDESKDRPAEGTVISIGPKVADLAIGDHIIFGKYAGTEYKWGTETLLFMREEEVISTVEE